VIVLWITIVPLIMSLLLVGFGISTAVGTAQEWLEDLPDIDSPDAFAMAQTTKVYAADGTLMASLHIENREIIDLSRIATSLVDATIAVEDERFYEHNGIDYYSTIRAAVVDIVAGRIEEGASTLTQQYVDNTILLDERMATNDGMDRWKAKFREVYVALELERRYEKDEILNRYLNTVYFGEGAYGAEAAAKTYFGKHARDLTLGEAALLAGLPQSPNYYNPYRNPTGAMERREWVLVKMVENDYVTEDEASVAAIEPLELKKVQGVDGIYDAPYFVAHVKKILQAQYSTSQVFQGGLRVYTTLDPAMQSAAEQAVATVLDQPEDPDCALVAIDPQNGYVRAMVGGEDWSTNKFNLATQGKRQPGSSFKTFVLVTALEQGISPQSSIAATSPANIRTSSGLWRVYGGSKSEYITIHAATVSSINAAYARLIMEVGAEEVALTAKRMGIKTDIKPYPSIALGSENVSPLEMASAYSTLANQGVHNSPITIARIEDSLGNILYEAEPVGVEVLTPEVAYATTKVLRSVAQYGTGRKAYFGRPIAGKTGTSQDYRDAWFVGYTPQLACSVWMGYYDRELPMNNVHGRRVFGGTFPAMIWKEFMSAALADEPVIDFEWAPSPRYTEVWKVPEPEPEPTATPTPPASEPTTPPASESTTPQAPDPEPPSDSDTTTVP